MNTLGMPPMGNHASSQLIPEKKMTPPDSKNPTANFASAFKNKVSQLSFKYAFKSNHVHNELGDLFLHTQNVPILNVQNI